MPLERVSKKFKDISFTFKANPVNKDLIVLNNANAIARSVRNLIATYPGERFFDQDLGTNAQRLVFEQFDTLTASDIRSQIEQTLELYEPRIKLVKVDIESDYDAQEFNVTIKYDIIGLNVEPQVLDFSIQPNR